MAGPEDTPGPAARRELDPKMLAEIAQLSFRARIVADGAQAGIHRSRHHGTSVVFAEHKEYSPGDNLRQLDWRAFARLDRDYIKRFEDESNLRALMLVDGSRSMAYPENARALGKLSKLEYATTCAGALAYVLARQGDTVGVARYAGALEVLVPPRGRRGRLQEILAALEGLRAEGPSRLAEAVHALSEGLPRRMAILVFTDLLDGGLAALDALRRLRARQHDVLLFHVLDADELDFPFEDSTRFVGMEDGREVDIDAHAIRQAYLSEVRRFVAEAEAQCTSGRIEYHLARTDASPSRLLGQLLSRRESLRSSVR